jgi:hypothetical protein
MPPSADTISASPPLSLPRLLALAPSLPEDLLFILLAPLITPHKNSRDHHLLLTSQHPAATADFIRHVTPLVSGLMEDYDALFGIEDD